MEGGRTHVVVCGSAGRLIALSHAAFVLASIQLPHVPSGRQNLTDFIVF